MMRQRHTLIQRVVQMRRSEAASDPRRPVEPPASDLAALEARVAHLERLLEGLQDSVHRETIRDRKRITDLEARIEPSALAVALDNDARERGL